MGVSGAAGAQGNAGDYRQTVDYKPVNMQCDGIAGVMPNPQVDPELVRGCQFFGLIDFTKGYWQLALDSNVEKCLAELMYKHLLVWIDDSLLFAVDVETYLAKLERLFELLNFFGFKLSVKKSSLYEPEVKWCGKIITGTGVSHDPERIKALTSLPYPTNASEL
ncbi:hypothetical protein PR001_g14499 [Phytophthora rubi]|uniref:Reverse transcriptase domain-containing protein n=1 Tax=Phytophthora rubi TaxID=129364 RepID=A0A6A3LDG6_9STRA|nr:hypothetical protein PR001_g14499 [Phytophthora rubi]